MTFNLRSVRDASLSMGAYGQESNRSSSVRGGHGYGQVTKVTDPVEPSIGKRTTTTLAYPTGVGQDPTQGHWILFEILKQNKGQLKAGKNREAKAQAAAEAAAVSSSNRAAYPGGIPPVSRSQTPSPDEKWYIRSEHAGSVNSSIQIAKNSTTALDTVIALYMPPSVQVKYDVKYADQEIGILAESGTAAIKAFQGQQGGLVDKFTAGAKTAAEGIGAGGAQFGMTKIAGLGGLATGAAEVIAIHRGQVITPRMELMFQGMGRRSFSYSFTFIPKSEPEAKIVEKIVMHFKKHMMPNFANSYTSGADGVREMTIPDHFNIKYMHRSEVNTHLNLIHTCALTSMDVDYGAERFTGYAEGRPQTTKIALSFIEFNIMSKDHIKDGY